MTIPAKFAKWGLGLFVFSLFLAFGIIAHYCVGASWPTGELFLKNITLWWACPWTLSVAAVQVGGLGMVVIGITQMVAQRVAGDMVAPGPGLLALTLCVVGLLGVFAVGYPGYFVFEAIWPHFYYVPLAAGKNAWLLGQAFFMAVYFVGTVMAFIATRHSLNRIA